MALEGPVAIKRQALDLRHKTRGYSKKQQVLCCLAETTLHSLYNRLKRKRVAPKRLLKGKITTANSNIQGTIMRTSCPTQVVLRQAPYLT